MKVPGFYKTTFLLISSLILLFSCTAPSEDISSGESENSGVQDVTSGENSGSTTVPEQSVETEKDIFYQAEWTSYHVAWNREGTDLLSQWLPWDDIQENFIVIKNGSIYLYSLYSWNQHIGPSSVEYYENQYPYSIRYEDIYLEGTATIVKKKIRYFYTNENGYTENLDFEKEGNKIILKFNGYYYWLKKTANTNSMDENLKDLYIEPLIDSNSFEENILIEDDNEKTISFNLSTHENEGSTGSSSEAGSIPTVIAYWDISSGKDYVSFNTLEGNEIRITNTNYSGEIQTVEIALSIIPDDTSFKSVSTVINLNLSSLPKKSLNAQLYCNEETVNETQTLESTGDAMLSYSINPESEVEVTADWRITTGSEYAVLTENEGILTVSNVNCTGEDKAITVTLNITPESEVYESISLEITFTARDSTADIQPGPFTSQAAFANKPGTGVLDGRIKVSWTQSQNAASYNVYRNDVQIANVTGKLYYLDGDYPGDISETNPEVTYYVEAVNLGLTCRTESSNVNAESMIPTAPADCYILPTTDSDGYYGVKIEWTCSDEYQYGFYIYRYLSSAPSETVENIIKNGKIVADADFEENCTNITASSAPYRFRAWDYDIVNEIKSTCRYGHYAVVSYNRWYTSDFPSVKAVEVMSSPSNANSQLCSVLIGREYKYAYTENPNPVTSGVAGSISISARKDIVYNWYSYCEISLPNKPGVTYNIYRCARMSTNFGTVRPSDCVHIGSTNNVTYIDGDICNQYMWENTASVGTYFWYMYYYVEAIDSEGKVYASSVVRAQ